MMRASGHQREAKIRELQVRKQSNLTMLTVSYGSSSAVGTLHTTTSIAIMDTDHMMIQCSHGGIPDAVFARARRSQSVRPGLDQVCVIA